MPRGEKRITLDLGGFGLPEVPLFGVHSQTRARAGLGPHLHRGVMEICYLVKGEHVFHVAGRDYRMRGGEVFWTRGEEQHGSGRHPYGRGLLYWIQVKLPARGRGFLGLSVPAARPLVGALRELPRRHFPGSRKLQALFEELMEVCRAPERPLRRLALAAGLIEWLRLVVESAELAGESEYSADIQRALEFVEARPGKDLSVADLARQAMLSESRFKAKFRAEVGMPPREYVLRNKVELAQAMLARGESVTRTAYALGFSSSQYFATVFKRYTHRRPSDVRRPRRRTSP
jgi:AraC-like DNA-binding protein